MAEQIAIKLRPLDLRRLDLLAVKFGLSRDEAIRILIHREMSRRVPQ